MTLRRFGGPGMHGIGGVPLSSLGGGALGTYADKILGYGPIAYWPLWEVSGTVAQCLVNPAQNGTYARDVSVMGTQAGIGDGHTAPVFTSPNDWVDVYSVPMAAAFNVSEGTLFGWAKITAATWLDGTKRCFAQFAANGNNSVRIDKSTTNNKIQLTYAANGVVQNVNGALSITDWFSFTITWSVSADQVKAYINGVQFDGTQVGLNVWAGALSNALCALGAANNVGTNPFHGGLAHIALFNKVLVP